MTAPARPSLPRRIARAFGLVLLVLLVGLATQLRRDLPLADVLPRYGAPPSRFVEVEGLRVHYRDEGSGPPIVLLHGTSSSLHTWDGWVTAMASHRRVVRLDMPGFGLTGPAPDRDYSVARYARFLGAFLDRLGIPKADLAGNSLGGRVALAFALEHPERVRKLVLLDPSGLSGQTPPTIFRLAKIPGLGPVLSRVTPRALLRKNLEEVYGDPTKVTEPLVDRYYAMTLRAGNRDALIDRLTRAHDPFLDDRLAEVRTPTLLLWGEADRWIPLSFGQRFHRGIRGSELVTYPGVGHVPMEESPAATARDAEAFLARD